MNDKFFLPATLAICVLVFAAWYQFVYEPSRAVILNMELETRRLHEVEREISELKARHGDLAALVEVKALQLDESRIFLPSTLAQDEFIDALYRAADDCQARIISVRADEVNSSKEIQSLVVNVRAESDYISLLNFIRKTLDGERLTRLKRFSSTRTSDNLLQCELSFTIFATSP